MTTRTVVSNESTDGVNWVERLAKLYLLSHEAAEGLRPWDEVADFIARWWTEANP